MAGAPPCSFRITVDAAYMSAGCNRGAHAAAWGPGGLVAFGAHNGVALYDPADARIVRILPGHSDRVNCVDWLPKSAPLAAELEHPPQQMLLSGSADGTVLIWALHPATGLWRLQGTCQHAHEGPITCIASLCLSSTSGLVVTSSSDSTVRIWDAALETPPDSLCGLDLRQTIGIGTSLMQAVALTSLRSPTGSSAGAESGPLLLAMGGLDHVIYLYTAATPAAEFISACQLAGHEGWVRSLDFSSFLSEGRASPRQCGHRCRGVGKQGADVQGGEESFVFLASASQDRNIRIWKITPMRNVESEPREGVLGEASRLGLYTRGVTFRAAPGGISWQVDLESLLVGHEDWVHSVQWQPARTSWPASPRTRPGAGGEEGGIAGHFLGRMAAAEQADGPGLQESPPSRSALAPACLLSASMDRTMMIWRPDPGSGLWLNEVSVGEASHQSLGFYGGMWSPLGDAILAHAYGGSFHLWGSATWRARTQRAGRTPSSQQAGNQSSGQLRLEATEEGVPLEGKRVGSAKIVGGELAAGRGVAPWTSAGRRAAEYHTQPEQDKWLSTSGIEDSWQPEVVPSGHFGSVTDISWDPTGSFLLSVSHDQTARITACWDWSRTRACDRRLSWHEIARAQIHGHDLNCATFIPAPSPSSGAAPGSGKSPLPPARLLYVSGAEEKVARVFEAPTAFLETLRFTRGRGGEYLTSSQLGEEGKALGANMSALGLSQKPIYVSSWTGDQEKGPEARDAGSSLAASSAMMMEDVPEAAPAVATAPPLEEHLAQNTLWPEMQKLYGHGNELSCMCASRGGHLLATACKAQSAAAAEVWLWETATWRPVGQLRSHTLTVTQMEFSPCDRFLLCVSRDRHLSIFERSPPGPSGVKAPLFRQVVREAAHQRIVWTASWASGSRIFATGSRDGRATIWVLNEGPPDRVEGAFHAKRTPGLQPFSCGVTALAWSQRGLPDGSHMLAVGLESGVLHVYSVLEEGGVDRWTTPLLRHYHHLQLDRYLCHSSSIRRLAWSSGPAEGDPETADGSSTNKAPDKARDSSWLQVASCGSDHSVRVFNIRLSPLVPDDR